jgi:hypothetical protein
MQARMPLDYRGNWRKFGWTNRNSSLGLTLWHWHCTQNWVSVPNLISTINSLLRHTTKPHRKQSQQHSQSSQKSHYIQLTSNSISMRLAYIRSWVLLGKLPIVQLLKNFQHFMEPEGLLPSPQKPSNCPYPKSDRSIPYHPILSL